MANFCEKCGRPLKDGEICPCQLENNSEPAQTNQVQQQVPQTAAAPAKQPAAIAVYFGQLWKIFCNSFKTPTETLSNFVESKNYKISFGFIGIYSILSAAFLTVSFGKIIYQLIGLFTGGISLYSYSSSLSDVPFAKIFFTSLIFEIGTAFLFALSLMLIIKLLLKKQCKFTEMLCVSAAKCIAQIPFLAAAFLLAFLNIWVGVAVVTFGMALVYLFVFTSLKNITDADNDKKIYTVLASFILFCILSSIFVRILVF